MLWYSGDASEARIAKKSEKEHTRREHFVGQNIVCACVCTYAHILGIDSSSSFGKERYFGKGDFVNAHRHTWWWPFKVMFASIWAFFSLT